MENKNVGLLIIGITVLIVVIILLFTNSLRTYVYDTCPIIHEGTHPEDCPAMKTISQQTYLSLSIAGIILIIGLVLVFSKPQERVIIKKIKEKTQKKKIDTSDLRSEDKKVLKFVEQNKAIFQADIIEKTGFGKAKVTRIIDRLENKNLVERKRRGMTNIVVLK